jgi:enoyl-CoA hydratase/carnithine racemase
VIDVIRRGRIAIARIAHGKANAFDLELSTALSDTIADFNTSSDAALVITGAGAMFSAGVDLVRIVDRGEPYIRDFLPALGAALEAVFACPKPIVAAVNGHAIAGGCILACAADYRVMARGAGRIGIPELRVGVPFPVVPLEIMRFAAPQRIQSLVYGGAVFAPDDAVTHGIVDAVADPEALIDAAVAAAEGLATLPAAVFELTKRELRGPAMERIRNGAPVDREVVTAWSQPATIATIRDYIARTFKKPAS